MNEPVFLGALSGALIFVVAAFLPYWAAKRMGQRISNLGYLIACLPFTALGCAILGVMVSMIPYAAGGAPISASLVDKFMLQAMGLPWVAVIFGGFVGRRRHVGGAERGPSSVKKDEKQTPRIAAAQPAPHTGHSESVEKSITPVYVASKAGMALAIGFGALFAAVLLVQIIVWAVS